MRIPKKVRELPWPEPYTGAENIHFRVTVRQPVADGERLLVVTFTMNEARRNAMRWASVHRKDLRLVCSKKQPSAAVLVRGDRAFRRVSLSKALYAGIGHAAGLLLSGDQRGGRGGAGPLAGRKRRDGKPPDAGAGALCGGGR